MKAHGGNGPNQDEPDQRDAGRKGPKKLHGEKRDKDHGRPFDPAATYREYRSDAGHGRDAGFDTWVWINDPDLIKIGENVAGNKRRALEEFLYGGINYYFAQFKSSHVGSEFFIHSPVDAMTHEAVDEIDASDIERSGRPEIKRVQTLVMNHDVTLAHHSIKTMAAVDDDGDAGLLVYKEEDSST